MSALWTLYERERRRGLDHDAAPLQLSCATGLDVDTIARNLQRADGERYREQSRRLGRVGRRSA